MFLRVFFTQSTPGMTEPGLLRRFRLRSLSYGGQVASPQGAVIVWLDRTMKYAAASRFILRRLWNTGSPAFERDDDIVRRNRSAISLRNAPEGVSSTRKHDALHSRDASTVIFKGPY